MASGNREGVAPDLWAEVALQDEDEEERVESEDSRQPEKPQIVVLYGRRRAQSSTREDEKTNSRSTRRDSRVSFAPSKRISWNRSLSTRGRESIVVAPGTNLKPEPKRKGAPKKSKQFPQAALPDLSKEKAYFKEVDAFELMEESPSPKNFGTWTLGAKEDTVVHDLPAILERWRLSKLAYRCVPSQPLFNIMETPLVPSEHSSHTSSNYLTCKTPERNLKPIVPLKLTSNWRSIKSNFTNTNFSREINEDSIITSLDALRIEDEKAASVVGKDADSSQEHSKDLDGIILDSPNLKLPSNGEYLSAFEQLLMACKQSAPVSLSEVFSKYCDINKIVKIGEGTYGEAFRAGETVCKIVPIDGHLLVNGEVQKRSEEVLEEVLLSLTLNGLRGQHRNSDSKNACTGFIETKNFWVCQGSYGAGLINAWEDWDVKNNSENDHPKEFPENQHYIVFALADGGKDLESFAFIDYNEVRSLLLQVTVALAVAETACEFEHRDLHWGNILLRRDGTTDVNFTLKGNKSIAQTFGVAISIIDFTLSRINTGKAILFLDLSADPGLFEGPKRDIQSETYRKMRKVTEDCWEGSFPKTNVLWLIYLVDVLLTKKSYKRTTNEERNLRSLKKRLSSYESATSSLSDDFFCELIDPSMSS